MERTATSTDPAPGSVHDMPDTFDLNAVVRDVYETTTIADPTDIAKEVERLTPPEAAADAYHQALTVFVSHWLSRQRGTRPRTEHDQDDQGNGDRPRPQFRSNKVRAIREMWRARLIERMTYAPNSWKLLGQFTASDLEYAATVSDGMARANAEAAAWKRRLAGLVKEHAVATVADLPDAVLADVLS